MVQWLPGTSRNIQHDPCIRCNCFSSKLAWFPFCFLFSCVFAHMVSMSMWLYPSCVCCCMSLTDGVAVARAARLRSSSWQSSPAGLCLVSIVWAWPGVRLERGRERTRSAMQTESERMEEWGEESGRPWPTELTLMEDGRRRKACEDISSNAGILWSSSKKR